MSRDSTRTTTGPKETRHIVIIGLGLIGGSLALALKAALGRKISLTGCVRRQEVASRAVELGVVDRVDMDPASAVKGADVVIISTHILAIKGILKQIGPHLPAGCMVSDVASTKGEVMKWARLYLPPEVKFVGGHPMAGKELSGLDAADPRLFHGCTYCLTPARNVKLEEAGVIVDLVEAVGARPLIMDEKTHDIFVAGISHLPLLLSTALVRATTQSPLWPKMAKLASSGYQDVTRLASGSPTMSRDICLSNREALLPWIDDCIKELEDLRSYIERGGDELEKVFTQTREEREKWLQLRKQISSERRQGD